MNIGYTWINQYSSFLYYRSSIINVPHWVLGVPWALDKRSEAPGEFPERWIGALETIVSFQRAG